MSESASPGQRKFLIDDARERLAAALEVANISTLTLVLAHLSGDDKWLAEPYRPKPGPVLDDNDSGQLPVEIQRAIREAALRAILAHAGPMLIGVSPEPPSEEVLAKMAELKPMANAFFSVDPPTHTRQKAIASKALHAARIRDLEPKMREEARALTDAFASQGRYDSRVGLHREAAVVGSGIARWFT